MVGGGPADWPTGRWVSVYLTLDAEENDLKALKSIRVVIFSATPKIIE
jgi:hypothetical protein